MALEDQLPAGFLLTTVEKWARYARSGGMFNNYAIVQGADHVVPVDIYLPGCPPRPEMLLDAILKLHDQIRDTKLGANRDRQITELEHAALQRQPLHHPDEYLPVEWLPPPAFSASRRAGRGQKSR